MNKNFLLAVVCAFASAISFFTINSYFADKHHLNALFIVTGVVCAIGCIFFLSKSGK